MNFLQAVGYLVGEGKFTRSGVEKELDSEAAVYDKNGDPHWIEVGRYSLSNSFIGPGFASETPYPFAAHLEPYTSSRVSKLREKIESLERELADLKDLLRSK